MIVPAHNEEQLVGRCVASLRRAAEVYRGEVAILVVADNCSDGTADVARGAGATVIERTDDDRRGKSYALDFGIEWLARGCVPEAVAVVDADSVVDDEFFAAVAVVLGNGAQAVQVHYGTEGDDSQLARLRRVAFLLSHWSRTLGAARLGLGTGLKGNGMAFRWELVAAGFPGSGVTEDAAMTLDLAKRGIAVAFAPGATVRGDMAATYDAARTQDTRWEGGRFSLMGEALRTAAGELRRGRISTAAAALEVGALPLSLLAGLGATGVVLGIAGIGSVTLALVAVGSLAAYVGIGLAAARAPMRDVLSLVEAPRFLLHKARVYARLLLHGAPKEWQRTERDSAR